LRYNIFRPGQETIAIHRFVVELENAKLSVFEAEPDSPSRKLEVLVTKQLTAALADRLGRFPLGPHIDLDSKRPHS
jgi:hypothetical protein